MPIKPRADNVNRAATLLGVSQAARFLERSENHVRWLANTNRLESFRDGANRRVFTREALERFQREQARKG